MLMCFNTFETVVLVVCIAVPWVLLFRSVHSHRRDVAALAAQVNALATLPR